MLRLRRIDHDIRVEMTPLMDVIFLLLTFFIYAMVVMVRADLLPVKMQQFTAGQPARPAPAVTISLDAAGTLHCDREPIAIEQVVERLKEIRKQRPETVIYIAADEHGEADRLPLFLDLYDRLVFAGLDVKLVGRPTDKRPSPTTPES